MSPHRITPEGRITRRRIPVIAGLVALTLGAAACSSSGSSNTGGSGGTGATGGGGSGTSSSSSVAASMASSCGGSVSAWNTLITAAQKEGKLTLAGPPSDTVNQDLPAAFKSEFGIDMTYTAGSSGDVAQKIQSERAAHIYSLDIFMAGGNTMSNTIYGQGWLQNLKSQLISPKLTDQSEWVGFQGHAPFIDQPNYNSVAKVSVQGQEQIIVNTNLVGNQIKGWKDLLNPKWRGKITASDPTTGSGLGFNVVVMLASKFGTKFIQQLFQGQKVVLETNDAQAANEVAKGEFAVAIGISEANGGWDKLIADGLPVRVISMPDDAPQMVSAGYGEVGLMKNAPDPNAAKLFANWVLCPNGNKAWNQANNYQSTRKDVNIKVPSFIRANVSKPGYWDTYSWKLLTSNATDKLQNQLPSLVR